MFSGGDEVNLREFFAEQGITNSWVPEGEFEVSATENYVEFRMEDGTCTSVVNVMRSGQVSVYVKCGSASGTMNADGQPTLSISEERAQRIIIECCRL